MRILIDVTHPAHVHFFKHAIWEWKQRGDRVTITSRQKDITLRLLDNLGFSHEVLSSVGRGMVGLCKELFVRCSSLLSVVRRERPDVMLGIGGTFIAPVGRLIGIPALVFTDTENATVANALAFRCATSVVTPRCYHGDVPESKHVEYAGYHELAYLHPRYFTPDPAILDRLGVTPGEKFVIMRFVGWGASHDVGHRGLSLTMKRKAVREFSRHARVFITSESLLPQGLEQYRIQIPPESTHHALAYASLLYGESATMASECAVLGTPAIYLDDQGRGYTDEQENRYGLVFNFQESHSDATASIRKGATLLGNSQLKHRWHEKRSRLLRDSVDLTDWLVHLPNKVADARKIHDRKSAVSSDMSGTASVHNAPGEKA
jgi:hypothetical protein